MNKLILNFFIGIIKKKLSKNELRITLATIRFKNWFSMPEPIKGTYEEFKGIDVDEPKKCTKLRVKATKDRRTCCGLSAKSISDSSHIPMNTCTELSINKNKEMMLLTIWIMFLEDLYI